MVKSLIDETFDVYMQMRLGGKEAKSTLEALRFRIQIMPNGDQAELVRRVKAWEGQHMGTVTSPPSHCRSHPRNQRLSPKDPHPSARLLHPVLHDHPSQIR